jgi:hypothetical protein
VAFADTVSNSLSVACAHTHISPRVALFSPCFLLLDPNAQVILQLRHSAVRRRVRLSWLISSFGGLLLVCQSFTLHMCNIWHAAKHLLSNQAQQVDQYNLYRTNHLDRVKDCPPKACAAEWWYLARFTRGHVAISIDVAVSF